MPSITIHLPDDVKEGAERYARSHDKSFSAACRLLIEAGLQVENLRRQGKNKEERKMEELVEKHTSFILQTLNLSKEILRCVFEKNTAKTSTESADELIIRIKEGTQKYIEAYLGREEELT